MVHTGDSLALLEVALVVLLSISNHYNLSRVRVKPGIGKFETAAVIAQRCLSPCHVFLPACTQVWGSGHCFCSPSGWLVDSRALSDGVMRIDSMVAGWQPVS
ncbi:hypothetical protein BD289DRAFT_446132 [Coniella lustricola]|uniref:Secreted protein n=1 Tax=Coniella lustricola TaxID=2025994 RepID=A0A2T2ZU77_9PEZI|nr:hypothetical protein BD289DRAFT_446132 [Coniella lustricola]